MATGRVATQTGVPMRSPVALAPAFFVLALAASGCSFDDKHEKYPDPSDPQRPVVQAGSDPSASASHTVPGWDLPAPASSVEDHFTAKTYYAGPSRGNQPKPAASAR